ncbi:MAG: helicase-associated domain-containing protein [Chloroflexota bacterium]
MPNLLQLLRIQDLGHLRIVTELWGLDMRPNDLDSGAEDAAAAILEPALVAEVVESLDPAAREALNALAQAGGRIPWAAFVRQFGDVREMGAGRRDREQPQLHPATAAEVLFYRALLGRLFFDTAKGPQEFACVPDDLLGLIRQRAPEPGMAATALGRPATPAERSHVFAATDRILDDATTLLAALRIDEPAPADSVLQGLLECAGILQQGAPQAGQVKAFLEMPRAEALRMLVEAWRASDKFNELRLVPGLIFEGAWVNQPRAARQAILGWLDAVPPKAWWSLRGFVGDIKQQQADFQRPAGDYDSWFVRSAADGGYLRGFSSWDRVDGALVRFLVTDVMHRLGLVHIAGAGEDNEPSAFRLPGAQGQTSPAAPAAEDGKLHISSQGKITASHKVPRAVRYQLARFCEWEDQGPDEYRYRISPRALQRASKQGLKVEHLVTLLARHGDAGIPAAVVKGLKRWESAGTEARTENQIVLRVARPEIIKELRRSKAARFLEQALGPTAIIIKSGAQARVIAALAELGILAQDESVRIIPPGEGAAPRREAGKASRKPGANLTPKR